MTVDLSSPDSKPLLPRTAHEATSKRADRCARSYLRKTLIESTNLTEPHPRAAWHPTYTISFICLSVSCALVIGGVVVHATWDTYGEVAAAAALWILSLLYIGVASAILSCCSRRGREQSHGDLEARSDDDGCTLGSESSSSTFVGVEYVPSTKAKVSSSYGNLSSSGSITYKSCPSLDSSTEGFYNHPHYAPPTPIPHSSVPPAGTNTTSESQRIRQARLLALARAARLSSLPPRAPFAATRMLGGAPSSRRADMTVRAARVSYFTHSQRFASCAAPADLPRAHAPLDPFALEEPAWLASSPSPSLSSLESETLDSSSMPQRKTRPLCVHDEDIEATCADNRAAKGSAHKVELDALETRPKGERGRTQERAMLVFAQFRSALERLEQGQREVVERVVENL